MGCITLKKKVFCQRPQYGDGNKKKFSFLILLFQVSDDTDRDVMLPDVQRSHGEKKAVLWPGHSISVNKQCVVASRKVVAFIKGRMTEKKEEVLRHVRKVDDGVPHFGLSPIWLVFTESGVISFTAVPAAASSSLWTPGRLTCYVHANNTEIPPRKC